MNRPLYVSSRDEAREEAVTPLFLKWLDRWYLLRLVARKQAKTARIDYWLYGKDPLTPRGFFEIKGRHESHTAYRTWMVANDKFETGLALAAQYRAPLFWVYVWGTECFAAKLTLKSRAFVDWGWNKKRNDGMGDRERCAYFLREIFNWIGSIPKELAVPENQFS